MAGKGTGRLGEILVNQFHGLIPEMRPFAEELLNVAARAGVGFQVTSVRRSHAQQTRLYRAFLRGETQYPVAPPGTSAHEFGYAFDGVSDVREYQADFGKVWQGWGGIWSAKDEVHFQYPGFSGGTVDDTEASTNPLARAADKFANLPWYVSLFEPTALTTESSETFNQKVYDKLCGWGWTSYCNK